MECLVSFWSKWKRDKTSKGGLTAAVVMEAFLEQLTLLPIHMRRNRRKRPVDSNKRKGRDGIQNVDITLWNRTPLDA